MNVEKFDIKDCEQLLNIDKKSFDYDQLTKDDLEKYSNTTYVLKENGVIVGYYVYYMKEDVCYLETIVVDFQHRNKGYSKVLLEHFLKQGNKFELHCKIENMTAFGLYLSNGFGVMEVVEKFYDDESDAFLMRR